MGCGEDCRFLFHTSDSLLGLDDYAASTTNGRLVVFADVLTDSVGAGVEHALQRGFLRRLQVQAPAVLGIDPPLRVRAAGARTRWLPRRRILVPLGPVDAGGHCDQLRAVEVVGKVLALFCGPAAGAGTPRLGQWDDVIDVDFGRRVHGDAIEVAVPLAGRHGAAPAVVVGVTLEHHLSGVAATPLAYPVRELVARVAGHRAFGLHGQRVQLGLGAGLGRCSGR